MAVNINEVGISPTDTTEHTVSVYDSAQDYLLCYRREYRWNNMDRIWDFQDKLEILQNLTSLFAFNICKYLWYPSSGRHKETEQKTAYTGCAFVDYICMVSDSVMMHAH